MPPQLSKPALSQIPIKHRVCDTLVGREYPLPGKEIPKAAVRKLHPWLSNFVGMNSAEAARKVAARWNFLSDRMLIRIRDFFRGFPPKSIVVGKSEAVLMLSRSSWDETFEKHWYLAPPPNPRQLRNGLRPFGFDGSALISDFMSAFGGLREEVPGNSGYFPAIQDWTRFDKYLRGMWDLRLDPKLSSWSHAVVLYESQNGDVVLMRRDQALAWWDHEINVVRPLRKTFRGFLGHYSRYIHSEYPFSPWAPPTRKKQLRENRMANRLEKIGMESFQSTR